MNFKRASRWPSHRRPNTAFSDDLALYLGRCRKASGLPLAVGFGIRDRRDVDFLMGKADIAVIGSQILRMVEKEGIASVGKFVRGLRLKTIFTAPSRSNP